ncbi:MAG: hypothetical protein K0Q95_1164 [Bacteroidota bacterium]|jgi:uncharacterized membrane protein|nr:hypothetical protein [Bacteroidota bacterium]
MRIILTLGALALLVSCKQEGSHEKANDHTSVTANDTLKVIKDFKGIYKHGTQTFTDCEHPERIYSVKPLEKLDSVFNRILPHPYKEEGVYMEMNAEISSIDSKRFVGELDIKDIYRAEQKNPMNTCIPYDFWCKGNEPFWQMQVSKGEGIIDFYDPMQKKTTHFLFAEPEIKEGVIIYSSTEENNPANKIQISLFKEKCSDGMSDKEYSHRVVVVMDKQYKGCAVKFGEK